MKNQYAIANTLALTAAILFVACRVLVGLFPDISFTIAQSWFHGIGINKSGTWDLNMSSFILGLISFAITSWVVGYLFTKVYRIFAK